MSIYFRGYEGHINASRNLGRHSQSALVFCTQSSLPHLKSSSSTVQCCSICSPTEMCEVRKGLACARGSAGADISLPAVRLARLLSERCVTGSDSRTDGHSVDGSASSDLDTNKEACILQSSMLSNSHTPWCLCSVASLTIQLPGPTIQAERNPVKGPVGDVAECARAAAADRNFRSETRCWAKLLLKLGRVNRCACQEELAS